MERNICLQYFLCSKKKIFQYLLT